MASNYKNSSGVDFDSLFDPDVQGDGPTAATFKLPNGSLLKYANIAYGSKGPDVGYKLSNGVDVSNLWAAAGTAQYDLPIDGQTFAAGAAGRLNHGATAQLTFTTNTDGTYSVVRYTTDGVNPVTTTLAVGNWNTTGLPASSLDVMYTATVGSNGETQKGGWSANPAPTWTSVTANLGMYDQVAVGFQEGSKGNLGTLRIQYRIHSTGQIVSDSTIYFNVTADGST